MLKILKWSWVIDELASLVSEEMMTAHRGVAVVQKSFLVAFGNDGIGCEPQSQAEVAAVREYLAREGVGVELAYAESDGVTWVMLISANCPHAKQIAAELEDVIWATWLEGSTCDYAQFFREIQTSVAQRVIGENLELMEAIMGTELPADSPDSHSCETEPGGAL